MTNLRDNPEGCVDPKRRGKRTCLECFWAQVNNENKWTGNKRCWNALCIVEERKDRA